MSITEKIDYIANAFASMETISMSAAKEALALLDEAPKQALEMIVERRIKFLWMPAKVRLSKIAGLV